MADLNPNDAPTWVKIAGSLLTALAVAVTAFIAFVDPWADARYMRRFVRCSGPIEKHLREQIFAKDYEAVVRRDAKLEALNRKLDANQDSITALTQIAKSQGTSLEKAMEEIPNLSGVIGKLDVTLRSVETTMSRFEQRVEQVADGHNRLSGIIEALRDGTSLPRPRRKRPA